MEKSWEGVTKNRRSKKESSEPCSPLPVEVDAGERRAPKSGASSLRSRHEAKPKAPGAKKRPRYRVRLRPVPSPKYPEYAKDRNHPFASMEPAERVAEIDRFLGLLWARTCRERKEDTSRPLRAAA